MQKRDEKAVDDYEDINIEPEEVEEDIVSEEESEISEEEPVVEEVQEEESDDSADLKNQLIRLQADFANYKKRMEKERETYVELGVRKLALDLLPVLDNLERALLSIEEYSKDDEIFKGINLIDDQLVEVLKKNNIEEIESEGQKFDPNLHHAVATVETDEMEPDNIYDVLQKGYTINDNVIRPSMVRVSKEK